MKRFTHLTHKILPLALTVQMLAVPLVQAAWFSDIQGHWAQNSIQRLSDQSILGGYPDGTFRPQASVSRAEYAAILVKALGLNTSNTPVTPTFRDVPVSFWAYPAVEAVRANGIVSGYPNGTFLPTQNITHTEAMAILANAYRLNLPDDATANQILSRYNDGNQVPTWARRAVAAVLAAGAINGEPNATLINPNAATARAEVALMTDNLRVAQGGTQTLPPSTAQLPNVPNTPGTTLQGRISTVPANTTFTGTLTNPISSELNRVGDLVTLTVDQPLVSTDSKVIVPVGSQIMGKISLVEPSGRTGKSAKLDIDFNEIVTPDGRHLPIQGSIATDTGLLEGGSTKGRIFKAAGTAAIGAGLGAALGTAMGPLSGGKVGKGAIYGTAIGGGLGALAAAAQKGNEVKVTTGDRLEIKLDSPLTVESAQ